MATGRRKFTMEQTKQSKERMGNPKKKGPTPSTSGQSPAAMPLSDADKSVKLQEQAIKIAFLEKQLAKQLKGIANQVSSQNSQASLPDSQASLSDDSTSQSGMKRKSPPIVNAVVLSSNGMKKHIKEIVKHEIWRTRKFVNNQDQVKDICKDIMQISDQLKPLWEDTKNRKAYIKSMAQNYGQTICSAINEKRSNIQSAVQKVYTKRFKDGLYMPTHNEFREIIIVDNGLPGLGLENRPRSPKITR